MPIKVKIDHARRYAEAVAEGEVSLEDIEEFLDAVIVADALPYRKLFDGRAAYGKYTDEEVMRLAATAQRLCQYGPPRRGGPRRVRPALRARHPRPQSRPAR
ncbi:MAG TPA: hypothetical protein VKY24_02315 [Reyranella sp.]|nr:hypothetical protein [Reyranella sp.]